MREKVFCAFKHIQFLTIEILFIRSFSFNRIIFEFLWFFLFIENGFER